MSTPAGISHAAQWLAWERTWAYLLAPHETATDSAGSDRPLRAGVQPTQHNAASAFSGRQGGVEEDDHRELTKAANAV